MLPGSCKETTQTQAWDFVRYLPRRFKKCTDALCLPNDRTILCMLLYNLFSFTVSHEYSFILKITALYCHPKGCSQFCSRVVPSFI